MKIKKNNFAMLSYVLYEICKYKTLTDDRENRLDEGTEHIVLSVLVHLTDTLPKHNGPNTTLKTFYEV